MIWVWTGTGNTARAAAVLAGTLEAEGWTVDRTVVRHDSPVPPADVRADLVVVACPALGLSTADHFLRWLGRWPRASGRAAILGVCGAEWTRRGMVPGWSGALLGEVSTRLRRAGRSVVAAADHSYPVNWTQVLKPLEPETAQRVAEQADAGVRDWGRALALGLADPRGLPSLPRSRGRGRRAASVVSSLFRLVGRRFLGKLFAADATCNACGLCVRTCPAGVISLNSGRPRWNLDCDACNRCINLCPSASIQVTYAHLLVHGGGNLALTAWGLALLGSGAVFAGLAVYAGGTVVQLTVVDGLLGRLERVGWLNPLLTRGWTQSWGRYRAPGFRG